MKFKQFISPPRVVLYWLLIVVWTMLYLSLIRALFLIRHLHLAKGLMAGGIFDSFVIGAKFDLVIVGYVVLPFIIFSYLPFIGYEYSRLSRKIVQPIMYVILSIAFALCLIDIEYYGFFGDHLGVWFWSYFDEFGPVLYSIIKLYPVIPYVIGWLVFSSIFIYVAHKFNGVFAKRTSPTVIGRIFYFLVLVIFLFVSIRGSISLAPLDWGAAYHSNNYFANDLSLNGIYTLSRNLYEYNDDTGRHNPDKYCFFSDEEALTKVQNTLITSADSLLEPESNLKRYTRFDSVAVGQQNVVIIILESWAADFVGAYGNKTEATPFFDKLAKKSLFFENLYASGLRTNRGMLSVLCSFPSLPGRTVMKLYGSSHPFMSIAEILEERNYESYFIYGGDLDFDNMGGFFRMKGFENFIGIEDFPANESLNKWGVPDHVVLEKANEVFASLYPKPFLGVIVTLTNHEPFVLPDKKYEKFPSGTKHRDYLNTFYYSDCALEHFFDLASQEEYFKNTIFVLVGDHGKVFSEPNDITGIFKIASLIYAPGREDIAPRHINNICGQVDLLPTILHLLGQPAIHESWGRDILSLPDNESGFAFVNRDDSYGWIQDSLILWEKVGAKRELFSVDSAPDQYIDISSEYPDKVTQLSDRGRAMIQLEVSLVHKNRQNVAD